MGIATKSDTHFYIVFPVIANQCSLSRQSSDQAYAVPYLMEIPRSVVSTGSE